MAIDFNAAMDDTVANSERPPNPPIGHYIFKVNKAKQREVADGAGQIVEFLCQGVSVFADADDVDPEELAEYGEPKSIMVTHSFYFNMEDQAGFNRTKYNLRRFLEEHLLIEDVVDMTNREAIAAAKNHQFVAQLGLRPDKNDPEITYPDIKRTAPVS